MIIQTTKKLACFLGSNGIPLSPFTEPCACWHGNILQLGRHKALLLTHNESYYSVLIQGVTKKELPSLTKRIYARLKEQLLRDNFTPKEIETLLLFSEAFSYFKSSNRRVLGVMNDMAKTLEIHRTYGESDDVNLSSLLNNTPYTINGVIYPRNALKEIALEMVMMKELM